MKQSPDIPDLSAATGNISCPLPASGPDIITLGHGSGGLLTHRLLEEEVFTVLKNELLDQQHDGAVFALNGRIAFSTDSYVIAPLFFPGGNIGDLAVNGTVNDLAMCGAMARYLSLSFIVEEGFNLKAFRQVLKSIQNASHKANVQIVTGDTKVVERGKGDQLFINTSGLGCVHPDAAIAHQRIEAGDVLIISGTIARHGIAVMSQRKGLEFETTIKSDTTPLNHTVENLINAFGKDIKFLRDPTRGGLASVLNEIAGQTQLGFLIDQRSLPLEPQVEGACEMLGLDPLYVANEGIFLAVVKQATANALLRVLQQDEKGQRAAIIGEVTREQGGQVILKSRIGGKRLVGYLTGDQLPRIC